MIGHSRRTVRPAVSAQCKRPAWRWRARGRPARQGRAGRQRGSFAAVAALGLVLAVAALGVLDVANLYLSKRALQNVADLAALAAAQQMDDQCVQPLATARANAASNGFSLTGTTNTLAVQCGRWDSSSSGAMNFVTTSATPPLNGVLVTVTKVVPYFFVGPKRTLTATATAKATVIGSFQVGTSLAQVNLLNGLLSSLLGGTAVNLDAVSWQGIANANIKVADLAAVATTAGTYDGLLAAQTSVTGLANILLSAVTRDSALTANVSAAQNALSAIATLVPQGSLNSIQLASISGSQALLQLGVANAQYAADATVNVLQMLIVGAEIAAAGKSPVALNVSLGGLSGVLPLSADLTLQVISPPTIAVGEPGYIAGTTTWRTQAQTAQILLGVNAALSTGQGTVSSLLTSWLLDVYLQLPVYVVVAQGHAWLQSAQCAATKAASTQTIGVQTGLANICLGTPLATGVTSSGVSGFTCPTSRWTVASVKLLGVPIAAVTAPTIQIPAIPAGDITSPATLSFDGNGNPLAGNSVNSNQIGSVLDNSLQSILTQISQLAGSNGLQFQLFGSTDLVIGPILSLVGGLISGIVMPIVNQLLGQSISAILNGLDTVLLGPLLQLLGVQLGVATVTDYPLACGVATLVK
ncbi:putative membrane protein [Paraburkholderia bannensis]|uniref:Putative membrane protein n=1 Tax=Paraburkholderia bannensis TaxID=765414 RepID=A0A7W9WUF4_9BURK|nr:MULTISPECIES: TadG family pilus assembly protein [Paraburkholderia]MBB3259578.1 putative membrane protein [Paraburkholderia sp. WP4_3_2]MBB6104594.1 putative membrane protein [Paraburkholderia bannensis]